MSVPWTAERLKKFQATRARMVKEGTWRGGPQKGKKPRKKYTRRDNVAEGQPDVKSAVIYLRKYQRKMEGLDGKDLLAMLALEALQGAI